MKKRIIAFALALIFVVGILPPAEAEAAGYATGKEIVELALTYVGKVPYVWGGEIIDGSNPGADCSGFICCIYEKFGFNFWSHRTQLRKCGTNLGADLSLAELGDIIWYDGHVAIFAGYKNGHPMIVHCTGGNIQNVTYSRADKVSAALKGVIRIPGVVNDGQTVARATFSPATQASYKSKEYIGETNAVLVTQISKLSGVKVTEMGMFLYDASGKLIKKHSENVSGVVGNSTTVFHSWYDVNSEVGVTLKPGTTYKYQFYGVFDGETIYGSTYSFTTKGTAPVTYHSISYNANGGTGSMSSETVAFGSKINVQSCGFTRSGYDFYCWIVHRDADDTWYALGNGSTTSNGWYSRDTIASGDYTLKQYAPGSSWTLDNSWTKGLSSASGYTFYAVWQEAAKPSCTVSYSANGGTGYMSSTTVAAEGSFTLPECAFTNPGYEFYKWIAVRDSDGKFQAVSADTGAHLGWQSRDTISANDYRIAAYDPGDVITLSSDWTGGDYGGYTFWAVWQVAENEPEFTTIKLQINNPRITVDGTSYYIDSLGTTPLIVNNRTLLPIRAVIEAMGGTVGWNGSTKVVTLSVGNRELNLQIDSKTMWDASNVYTLDTAPVIIGGRTMLPVRAVAEYFGATVSWDGSSKTTTIEYVK